MEALRGRTPRDRRDARLARHRRAPQGVDVVRRDAARRRAERTVPAPLPSPSCDEIALREEVRAWYPRRGAARHLDAPVQGRARPALLRGPAAERRRRAARHSRRDRPHRAPDARSSGCAAASTRAARLASCVGPPLVAIAGLSIVPAAGMTVTAGAVGVAAGLLLAVAAGVAWLASDAGGGAGGASRGGPLGRGDLEPRRRAGSYRVGRGAPRGPVSAGAACGVVGYVTDGAAGRPRARCSLSPARRWRRPRWLRRGGAQSDAPSDVDVEADATGRFVADGLAGRTVRAHGDGARRARALHPDR